MGAYTCKNCEKDANCIICVECYDKSNHLNHEVSFKSFITGACDCGDQDSWDPKGSCPDHTGLITSNEEIKNLIIKDFKEKTINELYEVLNDLFLILSEEINECENNREDELSASNVIEIISFIELLAKSNLDFLHIIEEFFEKNYSVQTNHICFKIDLINNKIENFSLTNEIHLCSCSILQNLLRIWDKNYDIKYKIDKILITFLKSYNFKFLFGYSYISLYDIIMINNSENLRSFSVQVITIEDLSEKIMLNYEFLIGLFNKLLYLTKYYLQTDNKDLLSIDNDYDSLYCIIFEFFVDIGYLTKPRSAKILSSYSEIIKIIIDAIALIQNKIYFKETKSFQYEGFKDNFLMIEMYLLNLFSLLATNFDYANEDKADDILFYLLDKICRKEYKILKETEYSFHTPLNRSLSIFLNRYSFFISETKNINLNSAINKNLLKYYNYFVNFSQLEKFSFKDLIMNILSETIKSIGFVNSIQCKYWIYYGENIINYNQFYYHFEIFYLCDFSLLQMILSQDNTCEFFEFSNIMNYFDNKKCYSEFMNDLINNSKFNEKEFKSLFVKNLSVIIRIISNNNFLIDLLAYSYELLKNNKNADNLLINIISKEKENFYSMLKTRLFHIIISKENSIYFSEINKMLPFYIKEFINGKEIEIILEEICEKTQIKNKPVSFKLKNENLKLIDLFYIIDPSKETCAEKYLMEFKKNEYCLLNTPQHTKLKNLQTLNTNCISNLLSNGKNIKIFINLSILLLNLLTQKECAPPIELIIEIMKLIDIYLNQFNEKKNQINYINAKFIEVLSKIRTSDINIDKICKNMLEKIIKINPNYQTENNNNTNELSELELIKLKSKEIQEKMKKEILKKKNTFKESLNDTIEINSNNLTTRQTFESSNEEITLEIVNKLNNINEKFTIFSRNSFNKNTTLTFEQKSYDCVICRNKIFSCDFYDKPYGRVGVFSNSSFIYQAKLQTIKKEYEKIIINKNYLNNNIDNYEDLCLQDLILSFKRNNLENKKSLRYTTCNHFLHYSCFTDHLIKHGLKTDKTKQLVYICPLCKSVANSYIPSIDLNSLSALNNHLNDVIKALTFSEVFIFIKEITSNNSNFDENNINFFKFQNDKNYSLDHNLIRSLSQFLEKIISYKYDKTFLISDFNKKEKQESAYKILKIFF